MVDSSLLLCFIQNTNITYWCRSVYSHAADSGSFEFIAGWLVGVRDAGVVTGSAHVSSAPADLQCSLRGVKGIQDFTAVKCGKMEPETSA